MKDTQNELEDLYQVSMQIITHAGNAQNNIIKALKEIEKEEYTETEILLKNAKEEITLAHKSQTTTMQKESKGEQVPYSVLFSHAQDTLMTTKSGLTIAENIVNIFKRIDQKIEITNKNVNKFLK